MTYFDHRHAAEAKAHSYVHEVLGLNPGDRIPDEYRHNNEYDALLKAFRAGVHWALDVLPNDAGG